MILVIAITYKSHPRTMKIRVAICICMVQDKPS